MQMYKVFFKESSFLLSDDKSLLKNSPDVNEILNNSLTRAAYYDGLEALSLIHI